MLLGFLFMLPGMLEDISATWVRRYSQASPGASSVPAIPILSRFFLWFSQLILMQNQFVYIDFHFSLPRTSKPRLHTPGINFVVVCVIYLSILSQIFS